MTNRKDILLKAAFELLQKQKHAFYLLDLLGETVFYDNAECDGNCLMEDIASELKIPQEDI